MCGIAGYFERHADRSAEELSLVAREMGDCLRHRGPDDGDVWVDPTTGVALAHRRLAIVDLSPLGHQPMSSADGRWVTAFNGEIYNFLELRAELEAAGVRFRGHSDTEVLVEGCARWGVEATIPRLVGMFAIALWDKRDEVLWLVRDRLGKKPLYWGEFGSLFVFGSELKALRAHPGWSPELNRDALAAYMRFSYVPSPHSIYKGVQKLPPGGILRFRRGDRPHVSSYWDLATVARQGRANRLNVNDEEAIDAVDTLLRDAAKRRMVADVPLGAFLSGGIDSSAVVAVMQAQSNRPIRTFSIGFHESDYDEAKHASAVAKHLGTDHTELYVSPTDALDAIPRLPFAFDEPFADSSQIPTLLLSELTRRHVTVALSGDGGDELFGGYNRYIWAGVLGRRLQMLPIELRRLGALAIRALPARTWTRILGKVPARRIPPQVGDKLYKVASVLTSTADDLYVRSVTHWEYPDHLVLQGQEPAGPLTDPEIRAAIPDFVERMQFLDTITYLPDDILVKVDRATMAVALEARAPFLDHRLVELSWRLPIRFKIRNGQGKWIVRQVLDRYVPRELVERPKMGFGVPIDSWLRGPLRDWAAALLDEDRLRRQGLMDPAPIRQKWEEHVSGRRNWHHLLWNVLMFQAWLEAQHPTWANGS
jgi:asparagine synthase (glutamine-hydrolysing)